jgi:uncharacterized protein YbaR (Trm112 family)
MKPAHYVPNILVSPDDGENLTPAKVNGTLAGFVSKSRLFHPVIDGIPVILPRHLRNPGLESAAVSAARMIASPGTDGWDQVMTRPCA